MQREIIQYLGRHATEDEDLLDRSARVAQQRGLREADAAEIVRSWRRSHT